MVVRIITYTQFGPFFNGSDLRVSASYARQLVQMYGDSVRIVGAGSGTYWFQDGATLQIYPLNPYPPGPFPPRPTPTPTPPQTINVRFLSPVTDPASGQQYVPGPLYTFTLSGLQGLNTRVGGIHFYAHQNQKREIPVSQLDNYYGKTIYVDQSIYAFRSPSSNGMNPNIQSQQSNTMNNPFNTLGFFNNN